MGSDPLEVLLVIIEGFEKRRREQQIKYERRLLRDLSVENMRSRIREFFGPSSFNGIRVSEVLEEGCFDVAIESYLLGGHFSRFGYYGESEDMVRARCQQEETHLIDTLFNFILYWGKIGEQELYNDSLYYRCSVYVEMWWKEGFRTGERSYKLRLH